MKRPKTRAVPSGRPAPTPSIAQCGRTTGLVQVSVASPAVIRWWDSLQLKKKWVVGQRWAQTYREPFTDSIYTPILILSQILPSSDFKHSKYTDNPKDKKNYQIKPNWFQQSYYCSSVGTIVLGLCKQSESYLKKLDFQCERKEIQM